MKRLKRGGAVVLLVGLLAVITVAALNFRDEQDVDGPSAALAEVPGQVARGRYLALAGDCMVCHTARGGRPYAGGAPTETPFGTLYSPNLTPDPETGLGKWTAGHFWRALHNGRSRDGRLLYPAFPYPNYTVVTRQDADALFAYLRSLDPVVQPHKPHELRFPYNLQLSLAVWRAMFFSPGEHVADPARSPEWNRGAYLVRGLGHCAACHSPRNVFGATSRSGELAGGLIPMQNWYAPSLKSPHEAGLADWQPQEVVALLKTGVTPRASVSGPMATVVLRSTQFMTDEDLLAMADYLRALPQRVTTTRDQGSESARGNKPALLAKGAPLYADRCAQCHGERGEGVPGAYPALAGNRSVAMDSPANVVRIVAEGGFSPATATNPRPFGMPPFATSMSSDEIAAVVTYVRETWGNGASPVSGVDVDKYKSNSRN